MSTKTKAQQYAVTGKAFMDELKNQVSGTFYEDSTAYRVCLHIIKPPFKFAFDKESANESLSIIIAWASITERHKLKELAKKLKGIIKR